MPKTKIGPHLLLGGSSDATYWMLHARPSVVKLVNTGIPGEFDSIPEAQHPIWIYRSYENSLDPNHPERNGWPLDPALAAQMWVNKYLDSAIWGNPRIKCFELLNEPVITTLERMTWYSDFCAEGCRVLREKYNVCAAIGGWSVGNPVTPGENDLSLWAGWRSALEASVKYGAVQSRHSYGFAMEPQADGSLRPNTWLSMRHRRDNDAFAVMGFPDMPVVITEMGAEGIPNSRPPMQTWKKQFGTAERYADELIAIDQEYRKDSYPIGGTVYTSGPDHAGWRDYNVDGSGLAQIIARYASTQPEFEVSLPKPASYEPPPVIVSKVSFQMSENPITESDVFIPFVVISQHTPDGIKHVALVNAILDAINWWNGKDGPDKPPRMTMDGFYEHQYAKLYPVSVPTPETPPWWAALKKGSVVVNIKSKAPIDYYDAPQGNVTKKGVSVDWDMVLVDAPVADNRIKDLGWLRVSDKIWVQSAAVKAK